MLGNPPSTSFVLFFPRLSISGVFSVFLGLFRNFASTITTTSHLSFVFISSCREPESFHPADFRHRRRLDHHHHFPRVQTRRHCCPTFSESFNTFPRVQMRTLVLSPASFISLAFQWTRVYYHLSRGFFDTSDVSTFLGCLHVNSMHHLSCLPSSPITAVNLLVIRVRFFFASSSVSTNVRFVASTLFVQLSSGVLKRVLTMGRSRRGSAKSNTSTTTCFPCQHELEMGSPRCPSLSCVNMSRWWGFGDSRRVNYRRRKVRSVSNHHSPRDRFQVSTI